MSIIKSSLKNGKVPATGEVTCHCFVVAEVSFLKPPFSLLKTSPEKKKLYEDLGAIPRNENWKAGRREKLAGFFTIPVVESGRTIRLKPYPRAGWLRRSRPNKYRNLYQAILLAQMDTIDGLSPCCNWWQNFWSSKSRTSSAN
jgi:hypothetical protein